MSGAALLVDYAGVLTPGVADSWRAFEADHGIPARTISSILWAAYGEGQQQNPIALLEKGELDVGTFEVQLAGQLREAGHDVASDGLVRALFRDLQPAGGVWDLVRDVRAAGVPAVLLSNSWGMSGYPLAQLEAAFDHLVFSGEVGMRKPDRDIFEHAAGLVDARLERCVFIDDAPANVRRAGSYGITSVLHAGDDAATRDAVLAALGLAVDG